MSGGPISFLPAASFPLTGAEPLPIDQPPNTVKLTVGELLGDQTFGFCGVLVIGPGLAFPTVPTLGAATMTWASAAIDSDSFWNPANGGLLIVPRDGLYEIAANVQWNSGDASVTANEQVYNQLLGMNDGVWRGAGGPPSADRTPFSLSARQNCSAGDPLGLLVSNLTGFDLEVINADMWVRRLGPKQPLPPSPPPPPPPTVYLLDLFVEASLTLLTAHTMDVGPGWSFGAGTYSVSGGGDFAFCDLPSATLGSTAWSDAGQADARGSATISWSGPTPNAGVLANVQDDNNFWVATYVSNLSLLALYERSGGTDTLQDAATFTAVPGTDYALEVHTLGDRIIVSVDGTVYIDHTFPSRSLKTETRWGLSDYDPSGANDVRFRAFTVTP